MGPRPNRLLVPFLALLGVFLVALAQGAPPAGLPLWAPGYPDPTIPFSDRSPVAVIVRSEADAKAVVATGIDVEDVRFTGGSWVVRANVNEAERASVARFDREIYPLRNLAKETREVDRAWPTWDQYVAQMQAIAAAHPDICRLVSIGRSVQGRDILFMKISDNPDIEENEPEFKYTSSLHGDEVTGMEMCLRLINLLTDGYGTDPTLTSYVDNMEIWICPHSNPDGYVAVSRYNAHGVDLNRSFPDPVNDPNDNPIGREPEVQAFMNLGYAHRFILSANYHGGALVVNYPWDCQAAYTPDDQMIEDWSLGYSYRNPPMWNSPYFYHGVTIGWAWYIIHGGMQDWCYNWRSDIDVTIEVSDVKWPSWSLMDQFWNENRDAMLWYMSRSLVGIGGTVTDGQSGTPVNATIDITQIGKSMKTDPDAGDFHRMLEPGTYTLQAAAFGYQTQTVSGIPVNDGPATIRNVQLIRLPWNQISGVVSEQGTGAPLAATVEARRFDNGDVVARTATDPGTGAYSMSLMGYTYDVRVTAPGHAPQTQRVILDQSRDQDFALPPIGSVIVVVADGATTRIAADLASLGFQTQTDTPASTDPALWPGYKLVVWSAGSATSPLSDSAKREALENFVASGGRLLIEGGQLGYYALRSPGFPPFAQNVLHSSAWDAHNGGAISIAAAGHALVTTPNVLPTQFAINYTTSGDADAIRPRSEATLIYKTQSYAADGGIIAYDDTPGDGTRGQIVYLAFNYDKLTDTANARLLLQNAVTWLDRTNPADADGPAMLDALAIGPAFPNPAAGKVSFRVESSHALSVRGEIIDVLGRRVAVLSPSGPDRLLVWNGRMRNGETAPNGMYYLRVHGRSAGSEGRVFLWMGN